MMMMMMMMMMLLLLLLLLLLLMMMMMMPMQGSRFYLLGLLEKVPSLQVMLDFVTVTYCDVC